MVFYIMELNRMNSVDNNKRRNDLVALDRSGICVSTVYCHCGSWFVLELLKLVLSIEGPLAILY